METMFGGLFEYVNDEKLNEFIERADKESALQIIETSIEYSLKNGLFSLEESFILYKMLKKLKEIENNDGIERIKGLDR
jgi:hypothetical protein